VAVACTSTPILLKGLSPYPSLGRREGTIKILTATARPGFLAVTIALQTLDLLLPLLSTEAVREVNEMALEGQAFAVQQGEEHRCDDPAQHQQRGDEHPCHT
jgi:hypothetical protein